MLVKSQSNRLTGKNTLDFHGQPMFVVNLRKCLKVFKDVYVSSDSEQILEIARLAGAKTILRGEELCGEIPNIPVYQHALRHMHGVDGIIAVQANSPTIDLEVIKKVKKHMESGIREIMTCHPNGQIYGSVWAISKDKLLNYGDPFKPTPDLWVIDSSTDIHTSQDYELALKSYN